MSVAVEPDTLMEAATVFEEESVKKNVDEKNDELLIAREKVAVMLVLVATPLAPEVGETLVMVGGCTAEP